MKQRKTISVRDLIFERDRFECYLCNKKYGKKDLEIDHLLPYSKGGSHSLTNLLTACKPCNRAKGNKIDFSLALKYLLYDPYEDVFWINRSIRNLDPIYYTSAIALSLQGKLIPQEGRP